jgi:hypothetical protein
MVKFINKTTGTEMLVANDRVQEYKAAGHKLAADLGTKPSKEEPKQEKVEAAPVTNTKRTAIKKKK